MYLALRDHVNGLSSEILLKNFQHSLEHAPCKVLEPTGTTTLTNGLKVAVISGIDPTDAFPVSPVWRHCYHGHPYACLTILESSKDRKGFSGPSQGCHKKGRWVR